MQNKARVDGGCQVCVGGHDHGRHQLTGRWQATPHAPPRDHWTPWTARRAAELIDAALRAEIGNRADTDLVGLSCLADGADTLFAQAILDHGGALHVIVLMKITEQDFHGVPLGEAVRRLVKEHKINQIMPRYEELRADPQEWARYQAEARLTDNVAGDSLPDAREEYPEHGR